MSIGSRPFLQSLVEWTKDMTKKRVESMSDSIASINCKDLESDSCVYFPWMSMVLLASRSIRITLRVHFAQEGLKNWTAKAFRKSTEDLSESEIKDFAKEMANLFGGRVKAKLETEKIEIGMSLPMLTRGFEDLFFSAANNRDRFIFSWLIEDRPQWVAISLVVDVMDQALLNREWTHVEEQEQDSGDVELL